MTSPFSGMDPYIEACGLWEEFHGHLIEKIYEALAAAVPEHYLVRAGKRSYIVLVESEGKEDRPFRPDVGVKGPRSQPPAAPAGTATALAEPTVEEGEVSIRAFIDERYRERFVEIYETDPEQRLVTCIEILSPSNKRRGSEGWNLYQRKRKALLLGAANLVEIDLLRGGGRLPMLDPWPDSPYALLVCRTGRAPYCQVRPAHFRRPLPPVSVPLAEPDPDLTLSLQPMVEAIYARARYHRNIDYSKPLPLPLGAEDQDWLTEQLRVR